MTAQGETLLAIAATPDTGTAPLPDGGPDQDSARLSPTPLVERSNSLTTTVA
jgi:hypothetical protein